MNVPGAGRERGARPPPGRGRCGTSARRSAGERAERHGDEHRPRSRAVSHARAAAIQAARQVRDLTGAQLRTEVVESRRIPDSADVLAVYRVELDRAGDPICYRRDRRYHRGSAQEGDDI